MRLVEMVYIMTNIYYMLTILLQLRNEWSYIGLDSALWGRLPFRFGLPFRDFTHNM